MTAKAPTTESLQMLNTVSSIIKKEMENLMLSYQEDAANAEKAGFHDQARVIRSQAAAVEVASWKVSSCIDALFMDVLDATMDRTRVKRSAEISLPNLPKRSYSKGEVVDTAATEVEA